MHTIMPVLFVTPTAHRQGRASVVRIASHIESQNTGFQIDVVGKPKIVRINAPEFRRKILISHQLIQATNNIIDRCHLGTFLKNRGISIHVSLGVIAKDATASVLVQYKIPTLADIQVRFYT